MGLKLYSVSDGPPSLSCRQVLAALDVPFELVDVIFNNGEHMTEEYAKVSSEQNNSCILSSLKQDMFSGWLLLL